MNFNSKEERHVVWAALCSMVEDNHCGQDMLTLEQWAIAEEMYARITEEIDNEQLDA